MKKNIRKKTYISSRIVMAILTFSGLIAAFPASALLVTYPFEVTGVLTAVSTTPIAANNLASPPVPAASGTITVNGLVIPVAANDNNGANGVENISTPTAVGLTLSQLLGAAIPGRPLGTQGFIGSTVVATGKVTVELAGADGGKVKLIVARAVAVDPGAEYQVLASVAEANCTSPNCDAAGDFIRMGTKFPGTYTLRGHECGF